MEQGIPLGCGSGCCAAGSVLRRGTRPVGRGGRLLTQTVLRDEQAPVRQVVERDGHQVAGPTAAVGGTPDRSARSTTMHQRMPRGRHCPQSLNASARATPEQTHTVGSPPGVRPVVTDREQPTARSGPPSRHALAGARLAHRIARTLAGVLPARSRTSRSSTKPAGPGQ